MKSALTVVGFVAGLITSSGPPETGVKGDQLAALKQLDRERIQAQIGADAAALDRLYAEDFIGIGPSGAVRGKAQVIADFTSGSLRFQSITIDDVRWRVYGNAAVETGRSTMIGQDKGKAVPRDNRFTRVWVERQGKWQLVSNHYSLLVAQQ
jgi:Ketosteroid isomerase homolog